MHAAGVRREVWREMKQTVDVLQGYTSGIVYKFICYFHLRISYAPAALRRRKGLQQG